MLAEKFFLVLEMLISRETRRVTTGPEPALRHNADRIAIRRDHLASALASHDGQL